MILQVHYIYFYKIINQNIYKVVHNGIITNYKDIKKFLTSKGFVFESETDTEVIAKLIGHIYREHPTYSFRQEFVAIFKNC